MYTQLKVEGGGVDNNGSDSEPPPLICGRCEQCAGDCVSVDCPLPASTSTETVPVVVESEEVDSTVGTAEQSLFGPYFFDTPTRSSQSTVQVTPPVRTHILGKSPLPYSPSSINLTRGTSPHGNRIMVPANSSNPVDVAAVLRYETTTAKRRLDLSFSGSSKGPSKAGCYEGGEKVGKEVMDVIVEEEGERGEEDGGGDEAVEGVEEEGEEECGYCDPSECHLCDENGKMNVSKIHEYLEHEPVCQCDKCPHLRARKCHGCSEELLRQDQILDLRGRWS